MKCSLSGPTLQQLPATGQSRCRTRQTAPLKRRGDDSRPAQSRFNLITTSPLRLLSATEFALGSPLCFLLGLLHLLLLRLSIYRLSTTCLANKQTERASCWGGLLQSAKQCTSKARLSCLARSTFPGSEK